MCPTNLPAASAPVMHPWWLQGWWELDHTVSEAAAVMSLLQYPQDHMHTSSTYPLHLSVQGL